MALSCHCGAEVTGHHRMDCGYYTPPTKTREGDQKLPEVNEEPFVQDLVIVDIEARKEVGIKRYGTALQAHNGRDVLRDAYEEAIDLCMYLRQLIEERDNDSSGTN